MSIEIHLLEQKCVSDQIDAETARTRIPADSEPKLPNDTWFAISSVEQMFLEDKKLLKDDIKKLK